MPVDSYDAIVIGGGHNGLVCASYLAKAGRKALVLERRSLVGGAAVTEELCPGFKFSTLADGSGCLFPHIIRDLDLHKHGLQILPADPVLVSLQPGGNPLTIWRDLKQTTQEIARFSKADAARYPDFVETVSKFASVVAGLMTMTPPDVPDVGRGDLMELLKLAGPARKLGKKDLNTLFRVLPMPAADMLDEWFESDALKAALAADGITGLSLGPKQAGTAYVWLTKMAGGHVGCFPDAGVVRGGMGALTQAIAHAAKSFGVEIRTGAEVARVVVSEGRATGVALASGEEIPASVIISNADPRTTFCKLLDPLDVDSVFLREVSNIKYRGAAARVHLALDALPDFGVDAAHIRVAPGINYLERAADAAKYGRFSEQPYLEMTIPSLLDPGLAPAGKHVMSVYMQYAPYCLRNGSWGEMGERLGNVVIETLTQFAPNLKSLILQSLILTPLDLETTYGLPEGSYSHGEMTLDQFLYMRPVPGYAQYRSPIRHLYLCGAGTHPGGGVTGVNGSNAAREVLRGWA